MRFIKNLSIPVIIVETMALDIYLSKQKKKFFQDLKIGNDFVSVFAKKVKTATTPVVFIHPFGFVELLEKTITQCRLTLKAFYEEKISKSIYDNITNENSIIKKKFKRIFLKNIIIISFKKIITII
jgi:hypothetical protein